MNELILHCGIVPPLKNVLRTTSTNNIYIYNYIYNYIYI